MAEDGNRPFSLSGKQRQVLTWWMPPGESAGLDGVICDGAVRSGKTWCLSLGFFLWSMGSFHRQTFALCGRTIGGLRRNLLRPILGQLTALGFTCRETVSANRLEVSGGGVTNWYYLFGGSSEGSAALIQGITLAGVLFDEVTLLPRSLVEQALARCSVEGSRFWFCCNPDHPGHWFYREWICKARERRVLYLHFTMEDNPTLTPAVRQRYGRLYSGLFHRRYVLGEWTAPQGLVYPGFDPARHLVDTPPPCQRYLISWDYGIVNPTSGGLWGQAEGVWYRIAEYYYDHRRTGAMRTDEEHYAALEALADGYPVDQVILDPSAASFFQTIRRHGRFRPIPADNRVAQGIQEVTRALAEDRLRICRCCGDAIREFGLYHWEERAGRDQPVKEEDHAMDEIRYLLMTAGRLGEGMPFALAARRREGGEEYETVAATQQPQAGTGPANRSRPRL